MTHDTLGSTASAGIVELAQDEIDSIAGGLSSEGGVGIGLGLIGIGIAIAAGPVGALGVAVAFASSYGGGALVGHYIIDLF